MSIGKLLPENFFNNILDSNTTNIAKDIFTILTEDTHK